MSKLDAGFYDGIRKAHKEEAKELPRNPRKQDRERRELLRPRDSANNHASLLKFCTPPDNIRYYLPVRFWVVSIRVKDFHGDTQG